MKKYLIRWENSEVYSITSFPAQGITYIVGDFLVTERLENANVSLSALGVDCTMIVEEISNPSVQFDQTNEIEIRVYN